MIRSEADFLKIAISRIWLGGHSDSAGVIELPNQNPESRVVAELLARVAARVVCEHRHPNA